MKIVLISPFYPLRGGIAQFADSLADELDRNHEVLRINFCRQYPNFLFPGKTQYVETFEKSRSKAHAWLDSIGPLSWFKTKRRIKKINPDVVIMAYWMPFMIPSLWLSTRGLKAKRIALVHNYKSHDGKGMEKKLTDFFLRRQDSIVTLSALVECQIKSSVTRPVVAIPHPTYTQFGRLIDREEARHKLGIPDDKKILLFFGLIREYKGLDVLINAFQSLSEDYFLLIAGEAYGKTEKWEESLSRLKNKNHLWHNQFISDSDVSIYFSAADLCVLPYKSATQSGVTAVAHHFHLPVIATDVGGLKEFIQPGLNGELVEPENPEKLAEAIRYFFDQNLKEKYSKLLQDEGGLSWYDFGQRLIDFVKE